MITHIIVSKTREEALAYRDEHELVPTSVRYVHSVRDTTILGALKIDDGVDLLVLSLPSDMPYISDAFDALSINAFKGEQ